MLFITARLVSALLAILCSVSHSLSTVSPSTSQRSTWRISDWKTALSDLPWETRNPRALRVTGELPSDLKGILYKAGPAKFQRGDSKYAHWLEGDGAVIRLEFSDGQATFSSRFVQTEAFTADEAAGYTTIRGTFGTQKAQGINAFDTKLKNPANTNALRLGDRVLALSEVGLPHVLDPETLETLGVETFGGEYSVGNTAATLGLSFLDKLLGFGNAVAAHTRCAGTKDDPTKPNLIMAGIRQQAVSGATEVDLWELDPRTGEPRSRQRGISLQDTGFPFHDFVATTSRVFWLTCPAEGNLLPYLLGWKGPAECLSFRPESSATLHFVDRQSSSTSEEQPEVRRATLPGPMHPVHFGCAWDTPDEGAVIHLCGWDSTTMQQTMSRKESLLGSWAPIQGGDFSGVQVQPLLRLTLFETADKEWQVKVKTIAADWIEHVDFVKCHPHYEGQKTKYLYGTVSLPPEKGKPVGIGPPQTICLIDLEEESVPDSWYAGDNNILDDFILIPKEGAHTTKSSRDAWIIASCFKGESKSTSFVVLDGANLSGGPLAEAHLDDHHIPWALHGTWFSQ